MAILKDIFGKTLIDDPVGEAVFHSHAPEWAKKMFLERYSVKLIN